MILKINGTLTTQPYGVKVIINFEKRGETEPVWSLATRGLEVAYKIWTRIGLGLQKT